MNNQPTHARQEWLDHDYHIELDQIDDLESGGEVSPEEATKLRREAASSAQFRAFQSSRKKVTRYYDTNDGNDPKETAFVYVDNGGEYICESYNILIWSDEELIKKHGGKYYLILDRSEYNSNDLEQLERMLFEWVRDNA